MLVMPVGKAGAFPGLQGDGPTTIFLPVVSKGPILPEAPQASASYFTIPTDPNQPYPIGEFPVFWFGEVRGVENYTDVRIAYNSSELYLRLQVFDRGCFYDQNPPLDEPTRWDGAAVFLNLSGNIGNTPSLNSYQFLVQFDRDMNWNPPWEITKFSYQGNGYSWVEANLPFSMNSSNQYISDQKTNCRGWIASLRIPFTSMGLSSAPSYGTIWGMAIANYDRDDDAGTYITPKVWPKNVNVNSPVTWGKLSFGLPPTTPTQVGNITLIRQGMNNAFVPDASVGGYAVCGGDPENYWTLWGDTNEGFYNPERSNYNIQNQANISDWPCFSKVYISFPLDQVPLGKQILSATMTLHVFGNAGSAGNEPASLIHVYTVDESWTDTTITWNNAPYIDRYISNTWVPSPPDEDYFPGTPHNWDVTSAVIEAYQKGIPVNLVLYSSDNFFHSGKYFVSSNTGDWNAEGRPILKIVWSD